MKNMCCTVLLSLLLANAGWAPAQTANRAEVLLEAAQKKELVSGDLNGAIRQYREIVAKYPNNRAVAAKALLHMGQCYEKLGDTESRKAYEQVLRAYADQMDAAAEARTRLAALPTGSQVSGEKTSPRLLWTVPLNSRYIYSVSPDGRYIAHTGRLDKGCFVGVYDLVTRTDRRLTAPEEADNVESMVFSRDGKQLAYLWNRDVKVELRVASLAGTGTSQPRRLVVDDNLSWIIPYDWTPDGKRIAAGFLSKDRIGRIGLLSTEDGSFRALKSGIPQQGGGRRRWPFRLMASTSPSMGQAEMRKTSMSTS